MGKLNNNTHKSYRIGKKREKIILPIDMTPVVDLAFLLLTFFMITTTFTKPHVMELKLPEKKDEESSRPKITEKRVLSIVPGGSNRIYWYIGITDPIVKETDYSAEGIRNILLEHNRLIDKMMVLIKPDDKSTYENLVNILDEMKITGIERYALVDIEDEDRNILNSYSGRAK